MLSEEKWTVFLSYSSTDSKIVEDVYEELRTAGLSAWFDREEILVGDRIVRKIEEGVSGSLLLILFISRASLSSIWCAQELELMQHRELSAEVNTSILPYLIDPIPLLDLPPLLRARRISRLNRDEPEKIRSTIRRDVEKHVQRRLQRALGRTDNNHHSNESPMYICVDLPTGLYYPKQRTEIHGDLPEHMMVDFGEKIVRPVVGAMASWWLERVVGHWFESEREASENAITRNNWSSLTNFYLIPQRTTRSRVHPLHGMLIALIVFHGCDRTDASSLDELQQRVLAAHPFAGLDAVKDNLVVSAVLKPEDCSSIVATLAHMVSFAFPKGTGAKQKKTRKPT